MLRPFPKSRTNAHICCPMYVTPTLFLLYSALYYTILAPSVLFYHVPLQYVCVFTYLL